MKFYTDRNLVAILALCFVGLFMLGCVASQQGQENLTNQTQNVTTNVSTSNVTITNQTTNQTINQTPLVNISKLYESDFIVVDDSMPNLITGQEPTAPPESG